MYTKIEFIFGVKYVNNMELKIKNKMNMKKTGLITAAIILLSTAFLNAQIPTDAVGYWPFNNNTNDESGNNNHGTPTNVSFVEDRFGNSHSACEFDGTSIIEANDESFDFDTQFSISFWIKTTSTQTDERWFYKNDALPDRAWFFSLNKDVSTLGQFTLFYSYDGTNYKYFNSTSTDYNDGNWHHVVLTFDGNSGVIRIYKDNILDGEDLSAYNTVNQNNKVLTFSPLDKPGIGIIDDVRIFSRALSSTEISELYNEENTTGSSGLWSENGLDIFYNDGNVGIGTTSPEGKLHVKDGSLIISHESSSPQLWFQDDADHDYFSFVQHRSEDYIYLKSNTTDRIFNILKDGSVGIGTTSIPSGYKLAVDGNAIFEEVKIKVSEDWADFVFEDGYNLMPLNELETYIEENNHLPEIPTTEEVEENGISVGGMNAKLLQKIEELTLYVIELQKKNEEQDQLIKVLLKEKQ